jgi:sortase A
VLLAIGVLCLTWYGLATVNAALFQAEQAERFERLRAEALPEAPPAPIDETDEADGTSLIGMIEIPRLRMSAPVIAGDDAETLEVAAGHLPDTPRPWEPGNSAIAAHRDGLFRGLKGIRVGDDVVVRTTGGDLYYRVSGTRIVRPDDLSVLEATPAPTLTLITCYPFNFIGSAPKRFVVTAERVETTQDREQTR